MRCSESTAAGPTAVISALAFTALVLFGAVYALLVSRPVPQEPAEQIPVIDVPAPVRTLADATAQAPAPAYRQGYEKGYYAFLTQSGSYTPPPQALTSVYTVANSEPVAVAPDALTDDLDFAGVDSADAYDRGYTDGYHKATESMHCPRYNYGR